MGLRSLQAGLGALRRTPAGLLGTVAAILLIEGAIASHGPDLLTDFQWDWRTAADAAESDAADADLLCFGDSALKLAVVPKVVEDRLGLSTRNLAVLGGRAEGSYFLLRKALEAGHRPRAVLVDFFPLFLQGRPRDGVELTPHLANVRDCVDLGLTTGSTGFLGELLVARLLPSFRDRLELREAIVADLGGVDLGKRVAKAALARNLRVNRGSLLQPSRPEVVQDPAEWCRAHFSDAPFHWESLDYVDRFLKLASSVEIPVYWVVTPARPEILEECRRIGFDDRLDAFLEAVLDRYPGVIVLDARPMGLGAEAFYDPHHLGAEGAYHVSHALCDALEARGELGDIGRWIALTGERGREFEGPLEDLEASAAIARAAKRGGPRR